MFRISSSSILENVLGIFSNLIKIKTMNLKLEVFLRFQLVALEFFLNPRIDFVFANVVIAFSA